MSQMKIPVMSVVGIALRRVLLNFPQALRVLGLYWLTFIVLLLVQTQGAARLLGSPLLPVFVLALAGSMMLVTALGLRLWLRVTLFGRSAASGVGIDGPPISFWRFLARFAVLQIALVVVPLTFVAGAFAPDPSAREERIGELIVWLIVVGSASLVIIYFWLRLGLVFPAMAANHQTSFRQSWSLSRGSGLRMMAGVVIIGLCCFAAMLPIQIGLGFLLPPFGDEGAAPIASVLVPFVVGMLLIQVASAVVTSALAYYYRLLTDHPDPLAISK